MLFTTQALVFGGKMTNSFETGDVSDGNVDGIMMHGRMPGVQGFFDPTFGSTQQFPEFNYQYSPFQYNSSYSSSPTNSQRQLETLHEPYTCFFEPTQPYVYMGVGHLPVSAMTPTPGSQAAFSSVILNGEEELQKSLSPSKMVMSKSMMELDDLLSKLNPMADEFLPSQESDDVTTSQDSSKSGEDQTPSPEAIKQKALKKSPREANRSIRVHREDSVKRTVYVADIDQQVNEEQIAQLFFTCGQVVDCRVCGDPNSVLRFAFVEFADEMSAKRALDLAGTIIGYYPLRVLPSKTAIVPVNPTFLPRSLDEKELCARTVYCANIDKKITQSDVKLFFESLCGKVSRLRLLGDTSHSTRIAFVEFTEPESAVAALNCSGAILGATPVRVSPSKTPVRTRAPPRVPPY